MQEGIDLTQDEVTTLEEASFLLFKKLKCHPRIFFTDDASLLVNKLVDANNWPKIRNGKNIHCASIFKISTQQQNKWEIRHVLLANILLPTNVPSFKYGKICRITLGQIENHKQYEVAIGNFHAYTCIDFVFMIISTKLFPIITKHHKRKN
jgi:hypothetical protein